MADQVVRKMEASGGSKEPPANKEGNEIIPGSTEIKAGKAKLPGTCDHVQNTGQPVQVFQFVRDQNTPQVEAGRMTARPTGDSTPKPVPETLFKGAAIHLSGEHRVSVTPPPTAMASTAPGVVKVRNIEATVADLTAHVIPHKVIVQGSVDLQIFYVTCDGLVHHLAESVPFHTMVDVAGALPGMTALVHPAIAAVLFHLSEDGATLTKKVVIDVFVKVVQGLQIGLAPGEGPTLLLPEVVAEGATQLLSETVVNLFTPAVKVDEIRAEIRDLIAELIAGKVIIQGTLHKQIFFVDTDNVGRHQAEDVPISTFIDLPGAVPGMDVEVTPVIETVLHELLTPDTVRQKVLVAFSARAAQEVSFQAAEDGENLFHVAQVAGTGSEQVLRRDVVTLASPAIKICDILAELRDLRAHILPGKVIVQGTVHKQIFFIGTDDIERHQAEDVPFHAMVEIPGAVPGMKAIPAPVIEDVLFHLLSPTKLEQKVIIRVDVTVVQEVQIPLTLGCDPQFLVNQVIGENMRQILVRVVNDLSPLEKRAVPLVVVEESCEEQAFSAQTIVENEVCLPVCAADVACVKGEIRDLRATAVSGGFLVEGVVFKEVRYVGADDVVRHIEETVPFSLIVETPGAPGEPETVEALIEQILCGIEGQTLHQVIVVMGRVFFTETTTDEFQVITELVVPDLEVESILVEARVRTNSGVELRQFPVITGLSGPGLALVSDPVFGTHPFQVVGDGVRELNVLESIKFDP